MDQIDSPNRPDNQMDQTGQIDEINLIDYWNVIWKWRKLIVLGTLACMVVAGLMSLLKTRLYKAEATFFITQKGQGGKITQTGDKVSMMPEPSEIHGDILTQMVKSRDVARRVMEELGLSEVWKEMRIKDVEKALQNKVKIGNVGPKTSGVFTLSAADKDPELAFRITESYLKNLQEMNTQMNVGTTTNFLKFIEDKLTQTKEDLSKAEDELRQFKIKYGIVELKRQGELAVQSIADLQLELSKTEANLGVLEKQFTRLDPEVIRTRTRISELQEKVRQLQGAGMGSGGRKPAGDPRGPETPTIKEIPDLTMKLGEMEQRVQIQNDIYKLLMVQYESAKIEVTKEARILQIIDRPRVPEDPEPRKAKQNTMIAGVVGLLLTVMGSFFMEYIRKNKDQLFSQKSIP